MIKILYSSEMPCNGLSTSETYTFCPDKVCVSLIPIASRMLKAILLPRRNPEHHYEEKSYVTMPWGGFSAVKAVFLS